MVQPPDLMHTAFAFLFAFSFSFLIRYFRGDDGINCFYFTFFYFIFTILVFYLHVGEGFAVIELLITRPGARISLIDQEFLEFLC